MKQRDRLAYLHRSRNAEGKQGKEKGVGTNVRKRTGKGKADPGKDIP